MSAEIDSVTKIVYVELLNEGTYVLRPTKAKAIGDGTFRLIATPDYDPDVEKWRFEPGTNVVCQWEVHDGERILVAVGTD